MFSCIICIFTLEQLHWNPKSAVPYHRSQTIDQKYHQGMRGVQEDSIRYFKKAEVRSTCSQSDFCSTFHFSRHRLCRTSDCEESLYPQVNACKTLLVHFCMLGHQSCPSGVSSRSSSEAFVAVLTRFVARRNAQNQFGLTIVLILMIRNGNSEIYYLLKKQHPKSGRGNGLLYKKKDCLALFTLKWRNLGGSSQVSQTTNQEYTGTTHFLHRIIYNSPSEVEATWNS